MVKSSFAHCWYKFRASSTVNSSNLFASCDCFYLQPKLSIMCISSNIAHLCAHKFLAGWSADCFEVVLTHLDARMLICPSAIRISGDEIRCLSGSMHIDSCVFVLSFKLCMHIVAVATCSHLFFRSVRLSSILQCARIMLQLVFACAALTFLEFLQV